MYCSAGLCDIFRHFASCSSDGVNTGKETYYQVGESMPEEPVLDMCLLFRVIFFMKIVFLNQVRTS